MQRFLSLRAARILMAALVCMSVFAGSTLPAFAEKTVGVSSGTFKFDVDAGSGASGEIIVTNDGDEPITVLVYAADQLVAEDGSLSFSVPNRGDIATMALPSAWIRINMPKDSKSFANIPYLELDPGERVPVAFDVSVPSGIAPGDHNVMVFFEMAELPKDNSETTQMLVSGRIGSRVTLRVNGQVVDRVEVRPFVVPSIVFGPQVPFSLTVRNAGNVDRRITVKTMLLDRSDQVVSEVAGIEAQTVFAASNLDASGTVAASRMGFGPHTVRVEAMRVDDNGALLDAGKDTVVVTRPVWVLPIWLLVAAGVIVLLIIGALAATLRRRTRAATAPVQSVDGASQPEIE